MEYESDSIVNKEHIATAVRFGAHLGSPDTPIETKKYILVFLQKILLQRQKLEMGLLIDRLESSIVDIWQEVLSTLEKSNRKLLAVQSGSLIFKLFCPTNSSMQELKNNSWIKSLTLHLEKLLTIIG